MEHEYESEREPRSILQVPLVLQPFTAVWRVREEKVMDKDRVAGSAKQVKGAVKETIGKVNWTPFVGPRGDGFKV